MRAQSKTWVYPKLYKLLSLFVGVLLLSGCESLSYYGQAVRGHFKVINARQPIDELIEDSETAIDLRNRLVLVQEIRSFAKQKLDLETDDQYDTYADIGRRYVVWNVFAAPKFSVKPHNWCYPIIGCTAYRGFFNEDAARTYSQRLAEEGFDVYVGGVDAYSTLGWFSDPVLNTFLFRQDEDLAKLLFHELAHQQVYASGDSTFNESFATVVEQIGLKRWLDYKQADQALYEKAQSKYQRHQQFIALVLASREKLDQMYRKNISDAQKQTEKTRLIAELKQNYQHLRDNEWGGFSGYDRWFDRPINNAQLATIATYYKLVPNFRKLYHKMDRDLAKFYAACKELSELTQNERNQRLADYLTLPD